MRLTPTNRCLTAGHAPALPPAPSQLEGDSLEGANLHSAGSQELLSGAPGGAKGTRSLLRAPCCFYFELTRADFLFHHTFWFEKKLVSAAAHH